MAEEKKVLLEVTGLKQYFNVGRKDEVKAIDDISFHIYEGETFGLVGESGSGKSTTGRSVIRLYDPTAGEILFDGKDISKIKSKADMQAFRRDVQMIFQDPYASLNPRMKVNDIIAEGIDVNGLAKTPKEREEKVNELLKTVGLNPSHSTRYPHEFSGGQRQRIGIARALAVNPRFIICDEPISALDVSIQAQVVNLLQDLQKEQGLTYLFIAHDLSMVKHISDRIGVMHSGKLLEMAQVMMSIISAFILIQKVCFLRFHYQIQTMNAHVNGSFTSLQRQMGKIVSSVKFSMDTMFIVLKTKLQCTVKKLKRRKEKLVYNQLLF